jgi:LysR family transcriptional regulator, mexEF-oprN operon transcriptional activator
MNIPDLNLLLVFDAVMRERNLRRAAVRLNRSQPAVSQAVARLRDIFADQLFCRVPSGVEPTPRAEAIWAEIEAPLSRLRDQLAPESFDARSARAQLRIGLSDDVQMLFFPDIVAAVRSEAPNLVLVGVEVDHQSIWGHVRSGLIDIGVSVAAPAPKGLADKVLFNQSFVILHRADQAPPTTLEDYLRRHHLGIGFSVGQAGYVDGRLKEIGNDRNVICWAPRFAGLGSLVLRTGAIATIPEPLAHMLAQAGGMAVANCPFELASVPVRLGWHLRRQADPLNFWVRALIATTIGEAMAVQLA